MTQQDDLYDLCQSYVDACDEGDEEQANLFESVLHQWFLDNYPRHQQSAKERSAFLQGFLEVNARDIQKER